ncbi:ABC-type multidrug transport system fused ATPase/permease subunit [Pedobacter sp. UYEF25]
MVFIAIVIICFLLQLMLPWWIIVVIAFATCGIIGKTGKIAFWQSFFAIFLLWIGYALFKTIPNDNILANRVAVMLQVNFWWLVLLLTGLIGGVVAGISGYCGYHFRIAMLAKKKSENLN